MTDMDASAGRRLDRLAEIAPLESNPDRSWWRKFFPGPDRSFSLVQDNSEIAQIRTVLERDDGFGWGVACRQTDVSFADGGWRISTHSPGGPKQRTRLLWTSSDASWLKSERIVEVIDGGEQIAHLAHRADGQPLAAEAVDGTTLPLTRESRHLLAAGALTIKKAKGSFVLTTTSPVPLASALLYWHLMLGDYQRPLPIA